MIADADREGIETMVSCPSLGIGATSLVDHGFAEAFAAVEPVGGAVRGRLAGEAAPGGRDRPAPGAERDDAAKAAILGGTAARFYRL